ncbi:MAG: hypothetical protein HY735_08590 [Verrucomicrobia bacterium]|nr:hypothetical protein [Verrucomicrobiota bacterium]
MLDSVGERTLAAPASDDASVPLWQPALLAAMAGGMGWGIRGQYGHETGAMIAGLLVSLALVFLFCPQAAMLPAARAVAMATIAMGFGGSMTYGQTIGLTQDAPLIGHWEALRWGLLGLAIKGAIWIGFAGLFLGMGLGAVRYRVREILLMMLALLGFYAIGVWLLNQPFDPANKILPRIYFSDDWRWEPGASLKPRRECWGGLLLALLGVWAWVSGIRRDRLARNLALWGMIGGGLGFPLGQSVQAFHAWNPEVFKSGLWLRLDPLMNWWNWMETTFGAVMGACLGVGLWLNRRRIALAENRSSRGNEAHSTFADSRFDATIPPTIECLLVALHVSLLVLAEFTSVPGANALYDLGLLLGLIPMIAVTGGRWWPFLLVLPITMVPIAGKTIRQLVYREHSIGIVPGWLLYGVLPLALTTFVAIWFARRSSRGLSAGEFARRALLICTWLYFGLNFAFFQFPWPWAAWTSRTPNGLAFAFCALALTVAVICISRNRARSGVRIPWR